MINIRENYKRLNKIIVREESQRLITVAIIIKHYHAAKIKLFNADPIPAPTLISIGVNRQIV